MSALLVPCTYSHITPGERAALVWIEGLIAHYEFTGLHRDTLRIVVADAVTGELSVLSYKEVRIHTGAQAEEHH